jgi:3-hydroxyacyl-[acyl-carrier-protein] dehydratase
MGQKVVAGRLWPCRRCGRESMEDQPAVLQAFDIGRILELLPHRYPFLMVDRIVDIDGDNAAVGIKNVTFNEPHFTGHFPGRPVMPGVLIIEGIAQTAGAICMASMKAATPQFVYFMTIDECKFRKPVVPGDVLEYHVKKLKHRRNIWRFAGEAKVGDVLVAEAIVSAMMGEP